MKKSVKKDVRESDGWCRNCGREIIRVGRLGGGGWLWIHRMPPSGENFSREVELWRRRGCSEVGDARGGAAIWRER